MALRTFVQFVASFPIDRADDDAPAGEELALFVVAQLKSNGFDVRGPEEREGWAWDITSTVDGVVIDTIVGLVDDMVSVPPRQWLVTNDAGISLWNRFFKPAAARQKRDRALERFCAALHQTLTADPRFTHIVWHDSATFDQPGDAPHRSP